MAAIYDEIGITYSTTRGTDPRIASRLHRELQGASRIFNIGAGTGSYEPEGVDLVAVEPSAEMISQRKAEAHPVEQASAESLPFEDKSFSHAMTVLSMHHWADRALAFREINRVATERFVALTWDPTADRFWLTRDYFPEIHETDLHIFPDLEELEEHFDEVRMSPLPIPEDCEDGFLAAFWKRPQAYLNSEVRQSISSFSKIKSVSEGVEKLRKDLDDGTWIKRNQDILNAPSLDVGYRIVSASVRSATE